MDHLTKAKISVVLPVKAPTPFLRSMTEFCIKTLRLHADNPFELIVCEIGEPHFKPTGSTKVDPLAQFQPDKYLHFDPPIGGVREINAGIEAASGDFIVTAGNDIIVPQHWDTEMLLPFEKYPKHCGISTLAAIEPNYTIGPYEPMDIIVEGMFSPFNMFRKGWKYDEAFRRIYQDSDLVMRIYEAGFRAFRNCRAHLYHFGSMTNTQVDKAEHDRQIAPDEKLFYQRWGKSPLMMFGMIRAGSMVYGREYEAWTKMIHMH